MRAVEQDKITGDYDPDERSGGGAKLGAKGHAKIIEYIQQGHTNRQINLLLVRDGVLKEGDSVSSSTYAVIRKKPESKVDLAKLTDEAVTAGHAAVSRMVVGQIEIWDEVYEKLMGGDMDAIPAAKLASYATLLKNASECILNLFAPNLSDRIREHIEQLRQSTKSAEQERNYANQAVFHVTEMIKRHLNGEVSKEDVEKLVIEFSVDKNEAQQ
jgi:hypothetical protein